MPQEIATQGTPIAEGRSVAEAVDGKGQSAKLIRAGDAQKGKTEKPGVKPQGKPEAEAKPATQVAAEAQAPASLAFDQIEKLLGAGAKAADDSDDDDIDLSEDGADGEQKPEGRFNRTVRNLRKRAQAAEDTLAGLHTELQKRDQMLALMQKDLEHQRETSRAEFDRIQAGMRPQSPDEMPLDPNDPEYAVKKFRREILAEAKTRLNPEFQSRDEQIEALRAEIKRRDDEAQAKQRSAQYTQYANRAAAELTRSFDQAEARPLNNALGKLVLTAAYGWKTDPMTAAKTLDYVMTRYALAKLKAAQAAAKPSAPSDKSPTAPPNGRGAPNTRGTPIPTREEAKAQGFHDELEAMIAQNGMIRT
jgi:hypothetical protein